MKVSQNPSQTLEPMAGEKAGPGAAHWAGPTIDALPDAVCVLSAGLKYVMVNRAYTQLMRCSATDLEGADFAKVNPVAAERLRERLEEVDPGEPLRMECQQQRSDGETLQLSISVNRAVSPGGTTLVVVCHDIGERKRVEDALRLSERRLAEAQRVAGVGNWTWDVRSGDLWWSNEIYRIFGVDPASFDATYEAFLGMVHEDDRAMVSNAVDRALSRGESYSIDHRVVRPGGEVIHVHEQGEVTHENGQPPRMLGTVQDISRRKEINDEIRRQAQIMSQIRDSVVSTDLDGVIASWNAGAERIFGYASSEAIGRHISFVYPEEERNRLATLIEVLRRDGVHEAEVRMRRKSGEDFYALLSLSTLTDTSDNPIGMVGVSIDVSERKETLERLTKLSSALEQTADLIMIADRHGRIEYVNSAFEKVTGFSRKEAIGRSAGFYRSGKHDKAFYQHLWQTLLAGECFQGVILNRRKDGEIFHEEKTISPLYDEAGEITSFISSGQDISKRVKVQQQLEFLAHYDALTDLPNRILLKDRLQRTLERHTRSGKIAAVLFIDLDRFKHINDTLGHAQGDEALRTLADRLRMCVRSTDTVARVSGDEFVVVLEELGSIQDVHALAAKILHAIAGPVRIQGHDFYVTASIGISLFPRDGKESHSLLKHADVAMYRAKQNGRNNFCLYSKDMSTNVFERLTLESSLRHALERDEFRLFYQPQVCLATNDVVAVEVLLRWKHPELGLLLPSEFMPLLEDTGLVLPVGQWLFTVAFAQMREWQGEASTLERLCINLSSLQLHHSALPRIVESAAAEAGLALSCLEFEVTESVLMKQESVTLENLKALGALGIRFAIDDFGSGYSSLGHLRSLPVGALKIDRTFIQELPGNSEDAMLVKAITAMARRLHLNVVAEGVETEAQRAFLNEEGCVSAQGFLFSKPLPADEVVPFILDGPRTADR